MGRTRVPRNPMKLTPGAADSVPGGLSRLERGLLAMSEFKLPEYPPFALPPKEVQEAWDSDMQAWSSYANATTTWPGMGFIGFPFLAELSQVAEYRQLSERLAQEMTRKWIKLRSRSEEDKTERLAELTQAMEECGLQEHFRTAETMDGLFGRGQLYVDLGDRPTDEELATPLILDEHKIQKGSKIRFQPIEPLYSYAYDYDATEPLSQHFYRPRTWYIMKRPVHHTRLLTFISRPVPTMLKPMYAFSGMSISQLAMPTIENFLKMRQAVANIVSNYSLRGVKTNLEGLLMGGTDALDSILQRVKIYTSQVQNDGLMLLDKEMEDFFQHTTPMTNIDKLLEQARDNMCAVANIPRMVLFGLSPEGMNASADGELAVFEQYVVGVQESVFRPNLERALKILQLATFGEVDPDITFDFLPLRELSEKELAEIRYQNAQADNIYQNVFAVASDEIRHRLATDPTSGWNNLDVERKIEAAPENPNPGMKPDTGAQENRLEN